MVKLIVKSSPADKPKIVFHATMMAIQNYGFFAMYFATWMATPAAEVCAESRFAEGYMALGCFLVAWLCVGMGFGGYIDDGFVFALYWIAHAIPAVGGYTVCTFLIPMARFSPTGDACAALAPVVGDVVKYVYWTHAGLYWCYVCNMVSITYLSFLKPTFGITFKYSICMGLLVFVQVMVFYTMSVWREGAIFASPAPLAGKKLFGLF